MTTQVSGSNGRRMQRFATAVVTGVLAMTIATAPGAVSAAPPAATVCRWYVARNGDQLGELAIRYRTDVMALRRANGLRTTTIYIGQRLCIPTIVAPPPPPPPSSGGPGAHGAPPPAAAGPWSAEFWNNTNQSGTPALSRTDAAVNFNWGFGSPDPARVFADNFSARWTRNVAFAAGVYRFGVQADDGFRLYVDGNLVLDQFGFEGESAKAIDVEVGAGTRQVRIDYVEKTGVSVVKFNYYKVGDAPTSGNPPPPSTDWSADYFNNMDLSGSPVRVARARELNFNWGYGSPASSVQKDNWSARFVQTREYVGGNYRVVAQVDDGIRVFVDDVPVLNEWREQSYRTFVSDVALTPGMHTIRVEYLEMTNQAALRLYLEKR